MCNSNNFITDETFETRTNSFKVILARRLKLDDTIRVRTFVFTLHTRPFRMYYVLIYFNLQIIEKSVIRSTLCTESFIPTYLRLGHSGHSIRLALVNMVTHHA